MDKLMSFELKTDKIELDEDDKNEEWAQEMQEEEKDEAIIDILDNQFKATI